MRKLWVITFLFIFGSFTAAAGEILLSPLSVQDTLKKGKNYFLFSKSENVESVLFRKSKKEKEPALYLRFGYATPAPSSNVVNGNLIGSRRYKEGDPLPAFDKIDILKGKYDDLKVNKDTKYKSLFVFTGVEFPLRLKLHSEKEYIDLELTEAGEWNLEIDLKNN